MDLTDNIELWLPEIVDEKPIGTADNFEGWSYFAKERQHISEDNAVTANAQRTTSVADLLDYPKGVLNTTKYGFLWHT